VSAFLRCLTPELSRANAPALKKADSETLSCALASAAASCYAAASLAPHRGAATPAPGNDALLAATGPAARATPDRRDPPRRRQDHDDSRGRTNPRQERSLGPCSHQDLAGHDTLVVRAPQQPRRAGHPPRGRRPCRRTRQTIGLRYLAATDNDGASRGVKDPRRITGAAQRCERARKNVTRLQHLELRVRIRCSSLVRRRRPGRTSTFPWRPRLGRSKGIRREPRCGENEAPHPVTRTRAKRGA